MKSFLYVYVNYNYKFQGPTLYLSLRFVIKMSVTYNKHFYFIKELINEFERSHRKENMRPHAHLP